LLLNLLNAVGEGKEHPFQVLNLSAEVPHRTGGGGALGAHLADFLQQLDKQAVEIIKGDEGGGAAAVFTHIIKRSLKAAAKPP